MFKGPHQAQDCPRREKLTALVADSENKCDRSQVNPLQLLNVIYNEGARGTDVMYVKVILNKNAMKAMLDTSVVRDMSWYCYFVRDIRYC